MPPFGLQRLLTVLPPLLLLHNLATADAITGRVVDANGVGVAGVDIDFVSLGSGGNPHELNDGTDASGNFFTTVDAGVYEIRFYPPPPPTTTLLTGVVTPVVVSGTKNMGTITLTLGVSVAGTVKNVAAQPVGNVRIDVFNATSGAKYPMKSNTSNAFGAFNVAVPANTALRTELLTSAVIGQVLVPQEVFATIPISINIGTVTLQPGFHVTGTVRTEGGVPISGCDIDVTVLPSGSTLFTPSDNTNSLGTFDVVVPQGTYDFEVNRPGALALVGVDVNDVLVSAAMDLGVLTLRNGVFLSGTVRNRFGIPVLAADVNVFEVATGQSIALGSDNTNAAGFYSVVVPIGLLNVVFSPPGPHNALAKDQNRNVLVTVNSVLDGLLPGTPTSYAPGDKLPSPGAGPVILPLGRGTPGTRGAVPHVAGTWSGPVLTLFVHGGNPGATAQLLLGGSERAHSSEPNLHLVSPRWRLGVQLDEEGSARVDLPLGYSAPQRPLFAQIAVFDAAAERGLALSHVLTLGSRE